MLGPAIIYRKGIRVKEVRAIRVVIDNFNNRQCCVPRMDHHIPGVSVDSISPAIVAFGNEVRVWQKCLARAVQQS